MNSSIMLAHAVIILLVVCGTYAAKLIRFTTTEPLDNNKGPENTTQEEDDRKTLLINEIEHTNELENAAIKKHWNGSKHASKSASDAKPKLNLPGKNLDKDKYEDNGDEDADTRHLLDKGLDKHNRFKRDEDIPWIWDACDDHKHYEFIDNSLQCVKNDGNPWMVDLSNRDNFKRLAKCPNNMRKVQLGNKVICIKSSTRRNGR